MRSAPRVFALALLIAVIVPAGPAVARAINATRPCSGCVVRPGKRFVLDGYLTPARPSGSRVYLQRRANGHWETVSHATVTNLGRVFELRSSTRLPLGYNDFRACLSSARDAPSRRCTPKDHVFLGRYRNVFDLTPAAASADFSVGPIVLQGDSYRNVLRFQAHVDGAESFVEYALPGDCPFASGRFMIGDDAQTVTDATFALSFDGKLVGTQTVRPGTMWDVPTLPNWNAHRLRITASTTGDDPRSGPLGIAQALILCAWR